jgi:hypothetical protein
MADANHLKKICLIDGLGAASSAFGMAVVTVLPQEWFGLPKFATLLLCLVAIGFAINSLRCWKARPAPLGRSLVQIGTLNLSYCTAALILALIYRTELQPIMVAYLAFEGLIIVPLSIYEIKLGLKSASAI